jgi:hypothetical protein
MFFGLKRFEGDQDIRLEDSPQLFGQGIANVLIPFLLHGEVRNRTGMIKTRLMKNS